MINSSLSLLFISNIFLAISASMDNSFRGRGRRGRGRTQTQNRHLYDYHFPIIGSAQGGASSSTPIITPKTAKEVLESVTYFKKDYVDAIFPFYEKDLLLHHKDAWYIKERYLGSQNYLAREGKSRLYHEHILIETESIQIFHHYLGEYGKSTITHSKCYIIRIISPQEWGLNVFATRSLKNEQKYNYWDYMNAWEYMFYYQNPTRTHSWFFTICPEIMKREDKFPPWFYIWWIEHSPELSLFPDTIQKLFPIWLKYHPELSIRKTIIKEQDLLWFCTEFQINWIWQWNLEIDQDPIGLYEVQRTFYVKWWARYDTEACIEKINNMINLYQDKYKSSAEETASEETMDKNYMQAMYENISKNYPLMSKKDKELKLFAMMQDQLRSVKELNMTENTVPSESGSFSLLAEDSQDPNEDMIDLAADYTTSDLWEAFVDLNQKQKLSKGNKSLI